MKNNITIVRFEICFKNKTVYNPLRLLNRASKVFWDASYCLRELCEYHFHSKCFTRLEGRLAFLPKSTFLINLAGKLYLLYCFHSNWISFIYSTQYLICFWKSWNTLPFLSLQFIAYFIQIKTILICFILFTCKY